MMQHDFILFQKRKKRLKTKSRVILSESSRRTEMVKVAYANLRYVPDEFSAPTTTFVYGGKTAIIIWGETPVATLIKSEQVAKSYRNYFEMLWKIASK